MTVNPIVSYKNQLTGSTAASQLQAPEVSFADVLEQTLETETMPKTQSSALFADSNVTAMMLGTLMQGGLDSGSGVNDILATILITLFMSMGQGTSSSAQAERTMKREAAENLTLGDYARMAEDPEVRLEYDEIVEAALSRLGAPYSQPKAGRGDFVDCSYLSRWCYREVGLELPRTAAAQAKYCKDNGMTISKEELQPGDLVFFSLKKNGRFMDISHVGIYAGDGKMVDASSSYGKVVHRDMFDEGQVLYARPRATGTLI